MSALATIVSPIFGVSAFAFSLAAIYFRGYLVPGTPTLTERYFPERVLRWFDKGSASVADASVDIDPERVLLQAGAVEPCREGTDLRLAPEFREAWRNRVDRSDPADLGAESLTDALDAPRDGIAVTDLDDSYVAHADDDVIGQWSSRAAVAADVAAAGVLADRYSGWNRLNPAEKARVLMSLRIFVEECPECGGSVVVDQEVVESCCRSYDVIASACQEIQTPIVAAPAVSIRGSSATRSATRSSSGSR